MEACFPGLSETAECTAETLAIYEANGLGAMSCEQIHDAAKADGFSGCGEGKHRCGGIFCCSDDCRIKWRPAEDSQWDIIPLIKEYQRATPEEALAEVKAATRAALLDAHPVTFNQVVDDGLGKGPREIAVEITTGIVEIPLETFLARLPAEHWGVKLDHYLGGEVDVYERDEQGRAVRQLERMVLAAPPLHVETPFTDMHMTKVEKIVYSEEGAIVYWRVMYSENETTETDVGTVSFLRHGGDETKVVFHSAHRLASLGVPTPRFVVRFFLGSFFSDHIRKYRRITTEP